MDGTDDTDVDWDVDWDVDKTIQSSGPSGGMAGAGAGVPEPLEVRPPDPRIDLSGGFSDSDTSWAACIARREAWELHLKTRKVDKYGPI